MHSVHKIQLTPGHNFIALAQEKPTKPLRPGEAPKTHLLHYKLDSKDIQQSSSGNVGGAGLIANGSDQTTCHNHFVNVRTNALNTYIRMHVHMYYIHTYNYTYIHNIM